jgi:hypothetical protein
MRSVAIALALWGIGSLLACSDDKSPYEAMLARHDRSTYYVSYRFEAHFGAGLDEVGRRDEFRRGNKSRQDFIQDNGAVFSIFEIDPDFDVVCFWEGVGPLDSPDPFSSATASCTRTSDIFKVEDDIPYELGGDPLDREADIDAFVPIEDKETLGHPTKCFARTSSEGLTLEVCYTADGWFASQMQGTSEQAVSTEEAVELVSAVPEDAFEIPDDIDDQTGQPF